jgi:hypothetical protein
MPNPTGINQYTAEGATGKAIDASAKAYRTGRAEDHVAAASINRVAAHLWGKEAADVGGTAQKMANGHARDAADHDAWARKGSTAPASVLPGGGLGHNAQTSLAAAAHASGLAAHAAHYDQTKASADHATAGHSLAIEAKGPPANRYRDAQGRARLTRKPDTFWEDRRKK